LLVFFSQLVACGQKGALVLADKEIPLEKTPPSEQQPDEPKQKGNEQ